MSDPLVQDVINQAVKYSDDYLEQCFEVWYSMGQPNNMNLLIDRIPDSPNGGKPTKVFLLNTKNTRGWSERADAMNTKAIQKVEDQLIDQKAEMLKRQAQQAFEIAERAREHLLENGFDTSSAAVNAIKWATEEERTVRGVSEMMIKISKMTPDELMQEAAKLLKRNSEAIDGEIVEEDADSSTSTP